MRLDISGTRLTVRLSKRNLLALLSKVDDPDSAKTIFTRDHIYQGLVRVEGAELYVTVEPDEEHYTEPQRLVPHGGAMHPKAEEFIAREGGQEESPT